MTKIKHRFSDAVLFEGEYDSLKACVAAAVKTDANLARADLTGANLTGAYLTDANLADAYLADAYLADAYLAVEALDAKMLRVIESGAGKLQMDAWHTCKTTHCRAGWAITLAGVAGAELEAKHGPHRAGIMIYRASTGRVPHFFASDERALDDIREQAATQAHQ